jgi:hypothetical protein
MGSSRDRTIADYGAKQAALKTNSIDEETDPGRPLISFAEQPARPLLRPAVLVDARGQRQLQ